MVKKKQHTKQIYGREYELHKAGFKTKPEAEQYLIDNQQLWTLKSRTPRHLHITQEKEGWSVYFSPKKGK